MKRILAIPAMLLLCGVAHPALAAGEADAMGMFYQMKLAPTVCKWTGPNTSTKLDATIADAEKGMKISASDKAAMMKTAEADIKSDPGNCEPDGMLMMMFKQANE